MFGTCPNHISCATGAAAAAAGWARMPGRPAGLAMLLKSMCINLKWLPPHSADPLPGISVSGLWFRCFRNGISKSLAPERLDFNISGSGASRFQDFQLRSVRISIFQGPERQNQEFSLEIEDL